MPQARLVAVLVVLLAGSARADGFFDRVLRESAIERKMALAEIRGQLGLYKKPAAPDWTARTWKEGSLEVVDGVPILRLEGTPEEMAEQHARLLGKEARALAESYLPAFVGGKKELEKARARARELFWPHMTDSEKEEVRVFARESGIDERDVLLAQSFADLYRAWGCSTLAAVKEGAADGPLLARNLDFVSMGFIQDYSCVVVARPAGKKPYVSVAWPGILGVLSAQNDSVAVSVMVVHGDRGCEAGVPFGLAFRRAIEACSSAEDVQRALEATRLTVANNLMVVDKDGGARLLELVPGEGKIVARRPDARGHLASTNHFRSSELRESRASLTYLSSVRRLEAVEKTCASEPRVGLDAAKTALRASAPARINVQSMIFEPSSGVVHVAFGKPPAAERRFVKLERAALLGR